MACGDSVTVTLTATDGTDTCSKTYTFTKVEKKANIAYLSLPSGWGSTVRCYAYDDATGKICNADWPGVEMTIDEETGYYMYEIPETIEQPRIIFYNSGENRMPGSGERGLLFEEDGSYLYKDGEWSQYEKPIITGTVTIKYVDEAGNTLAPDSVSTVTYNSQYSVVSPIIDGYMANQATVSGLMKNDLTVTVTYTATHNTLNILYILADGNVEYSRYTGTFATGATYSIPSPEIDGYSPDMAVVSGTMSASGATVYVYYHHNTYTVTFDAAGGECTTDAMTVMYHHMYGHDGALPSAVRVGYRFDGWYLGNTRITEESYVNIASDHTLTARWIAYTFTITIHYTYADGTEALPDQMHTLAYGEQYRFDAAPIAGYTASPPTISGTMSAQNAVTTIVYTPNDYTLTIFYVYAGDGIHQQGETAAPTYQASVKHGQTVVVSSPIIAGYHAQETVSLTVNAADAVFTIYYYLNAPIIAVTVEWGSMTFDFTGGEWNPDKHAFEGQTIQPSTTDCNKITVTNDASNIAVHMDLSYHAESAYANLSAYFTKTASPSDVAHAGFQDEILAVGESFDTWIWITGIFDVLPDGEFVSGRCTVTIRGGT